ncbi:MAG: bifunctional adenosylcobinamide kinase/adenosylcobinamide-phosphate guanylyltransferase [Coriobacteriia bacterium]
MGLIVFTGGTRSGKSFAAQTLALRRSLDGASVVVAVFGRPDPSDTELAERVARHQADRPAAFATLEATSAVDWVDAVPGDCLLVIDCLGTLLGLAMDAAWQDCGAELTDAPESSLPAGFELALEREFGRALDWILARDGDTIVVTNEVGDGVVPAYASGRVFRDLLGRANRRLISAADAAWLCVAGRLIDLQRLPQEAWWPAD